MRKHYKNETPRFPNVLEGLRSLAASRCVSALRFSMSSICFQPRCGAARSCPPCNGTVDGGDELRCSSVRSLRCVLSPPHFPCVGLAWTAPFRGCQVSVMLSYSPRSIERSKDTWPTICLVATDAGIFCSMAIYASHQTMSRWVMMSC